MSLDLLLRHHVRTGDAGSLEIAVATLDAMAAGGMYDQVGGGFHRYSVDAQWLVPHFEKMLYDQATLARAYLHAWLVDPGETATGACWRRSSGTSCGTCATRPGASTPPRTPTARARKASSTSGRSTSSCPSCRPPGSPRPRRTRWPPGGVSRRPATSRATTSRTWPVSRSTPPAGRDAAPQRRPPWSGPGRRCSTIGRSASGPVSTTRSSPGGTACSSRCWPRRRRRWAGRTGWTRPGTNARFLLAELRGKNGRLLRSWQARLPAEGGSRARHLGYAEDYAALLGALVTLAEVDDVAWLAPAGEIAAGLCSLFADQGGFYTTGIDAEALITRPRDVFDNATPSANSLAANALLRLAALTGEPRWQEAGEVAVRAVGPTMGEHPSAFADLLGALERMVTPPLEIAVVGDPADPATAALTGEVRRRFLPGAVSVTAPPGTGADLTPLLADRPLADGKPTAYVCQHFACQRPVTDPAALSEQLDEALRT